ncbi:DNA-binding protein [Stutzerimonas stutzeri]|uniref:DNA-binding protein n=1 Tax=Stutzerimonas stutzeri TaxID=316 RepID=W8QTH3_STUST|nr:SdiA-regulated domain-containing protein [Stutzerimonas stutzeri]AHL73865.1 DNA-binding protein [Stutzerimonas stutzeri]MCQ4328613.1 SdiA-regulated domain-containing protein [Stutzerimonas stutzeri]
MSAKPSRRSRLQRFLYALLALCIIAATIAGALLHWDDQLELYWQEQSADAEQRAASIWLPDYELVLETTLVGLEKDQTSGLTWNPATGTLFTVTGRNPQLIEFSPGGVVLRRVRLTGFSDPEAVEALDDGRMAIVDERRRLVAVFRLPLGVESLDLADIASYDLGFEGAGNKGFEGLAWNPRSRRLLLAKERDPQGLFELSIPDDGGIAGALEAQPEQPLLVRDISSVAFDPRTGHTLMLSDESRLLVELDLQGRPRSFISLLGGLNGLVDGIDQAEGVAMDERGDIYVVGEPNRFYVFSRRR